MTAGTDVLDGLLEQAVAAPFCSSRLADAGAHSSYFVWAEFGPGHAAINGEITS